MTERALAHELLAKKRGSQVLYLQLLAQLQIEQKDFLTALQTLEDALVVKHDVSDHGNFQQVFFRIVALQKKSLKIIRRCRKL